MSKVREINGVLCDAKGEPLTVEVVWPSYFCANEDGMLKLAQDTGAGPAHPAVQRAETLVKLDAAKRVLADLERQAKRIALPGLPKLRAKVERLSADADSLRGWGL